MRRIVPMVAGEASRGAVPKVRLMPRMTSRTLMSVVGDDNPWCWWATEMDANRRVIVDDFSVEARSVMYRTTTVGSAGRDSKPRAWHQDEKSSKSDR